MSGKTQTIGFMQGRLCERVDGMIQAFPWRDWESEFPAAAAIDLHLMEWTLDQDRLYENPLMTEDGQKRIRELCQHHDISIRSLTGDCFMQAPFWKSENDSMVSLQRDFLAVCQACADVRIQMIVIPLVDNGRLETAEQEEILINFLLKHESLFSKNNQQVIFESDFMPVELARFIDRLPPGQFGVNYDIGNSAALDFDPADEFSAYGKRVVNVHVKDRLLGDTTVPLGIGNAKFEAVFFELSRIRYQGNFILQTARADDGKHAEVLSVYRNMTLRWIEQAGLAV